MSTYRTYRVLKDRVLRGETCAKAGQIVFDCRGYDYGSASDDTHVLSIPHTSVTLNKDGSYPFFTIPTADLEVVS